jgi:putative alpha-1,2-mannosidase
MGIYPVTPGNTYYAIGSPLYGKVTIDLGKNKTFTIGARINSQKNKYIQSASINGKPITRTWLTQKEITDGGILLFEMGPEPNKKWGTKPEDAPPSMSKR